MKLAATRPKLKQISAHGFVAVYVVLATFLAGLASTNIAYGFAFDGLKIPLREPLNLGIVLVFYWLFLKYQPNAIITQMSIGGFWSACFGIGATIVLLLAVWLIFWQTGVLANIAARTIDGQTALSIAVGFIFVFIHGLSEQWLIQKIGQQLLANTYGIWAGLIGAGAMFAILQALQGYNAPIYMLNSFAFGVFMAILAHKFGLLAAAAAHGFWTWGEVIYLPTAFTFQFRPAVFVGYGPDSYGSIVFTIVTTLLCLILGIATNINYKPNNDEIKH